jgi:hypothetical protein
MGLQLQLKFVNNNNFQGDPGQKSYHKNIMMAIDAKNPLHYLDELKFRGFYFL